MRIWKVRLLTLLTAVAMLLTISGSVAMADDDDWDDGSWYGCYSWYYYPYYYYGDDDWGND